MMKMIQRLGILIPLFVMLTLAANVQGQSGPLANAGDLDGPPGGLAIPNDASAGAPGVMMSPTPADVSGGAESIGLGEILEPVPFGETNGYCLENVAPLESTGSWLRRGYWFVEQDVLLFNRQWDKSRRDMILAQDPTTRALAMSAGCRSIRAAQVSSPTCDLRSDDSCSGMTKTAITSPSSRMLVVASRN